MQGSNWERSKRSSMPGVSNPILIDGAVVKSANRKGSLTDAPTSPKASFLPEELLSPKEGLAAWHASLMGLVTFDKAMIERAVNPYKISSPASPPCSPPQSPSKAEGVFVLRLFGSPKPKEPLLTTPERSGIIPEMVALEVGKADLEKLTADSNQYIQQEQLIAEMRKAVTVHLNAALKEQYGYFSRADFVALRKQGNTSQVKVMECTIDHKTLSVRTNVPSEVSLEKLAGLKNETLRQLVGVIDSKMSPEVRHPGERPYISPEKDGAGTYPRIPRQDSDALNQFEAEIKKIHNTMYRKKSVSVDPHEYITQTVDFTYEGTEEDALLFVQTLRKAREKLGIPKALMRFVPPSVDPECYSSSEDLIETLEESIRKSPNPSAKVELPEFPIRAIITLPRCAFTPDEALKKAFRLVRGAAQTVASDLTKEERESIGLASKVLQGERDQLEAKRIYGDLKKIDPHRAEGYRQQLEAERAGRGKCFGEHE